MEADLLQCYGIDLTGGIMRRRTARWLRVKILGLLATDSRLLRAVAKPDPAPSAPVIPETGE